MYCVSSYLPKKGFTVPGSPSAVIGKEEVKAISSPISISEMNEKKKQRLDKALKLLTNPEVLFCFPFIYLFISQNMKMTMHWFCVNFINSEKDFYFYMKN